MSSAYLAYLLPRHAAAILGCTEEDLRARCKRAAPDNGATASLGSSDIEAFKFGGTWRISFHESAQVAEEAPARTSRRLALHHLIDVILTERDPALLDVVEAVLAYRRAFWVKGRRR